MEKRGNPYSGSEESIWSSQYPVDFEGSRSSIIESSDNGDQEDFDEIGRQIA
jgi:hypothetical protein